MIDNTWRTAISGCALATFATFALSANAVAQTAVAVPANAPKGTVRLTSTFPTGSGPDVVARLVAAKMAARWNTQVVVDAKPGGAGVNAINSMKKGSIAGNDLVVVDVGNLVINPLIFKRLAYNPDKELVPVAVLYKTAFFVAVGADSPIKSIADLKAAAKGPVPLAYGSNAVGGPIHLSSSRLATALGVEMQHVPYKETSQLYPAVSTGEVTWAYGSIATAGSLLRANKLRFLAVADKHRSPVLPQVPTLEEAGGPKGVDALSWVAIMAPAGTPKAVVSEINAAINEALAQADIREKMSNFGFSASFGPAQQVTDLMREDRTTYVEVLKKVKVEVD
jgi:tripartite-type tricarboxylate transporter receptor subunit TctC